MDKALSCATTSDQSGLGSDGNQGILCISQSITGASPLDCLVSYPRHSSRESYPSEEMQSVYLAPADWAINRITRVE